MVLAYDFDTGVLLDLTDTDVLHWMIWCFIQDAVQTGAIVRTFFPKPLGWGTCCHLRCAFSNYGSVDNILYFF
jgi:hypothetical protein